MSAPAPPAHADPHLNSVLEARPAGLTDNSEGMAYLERLPRRLVTTYLPLLLILAVLLFPFYWMALTAIKPDEQLIDMERFNPFWVVDPTLKHINKLLFETQYPRWLWNTMYVSVAATVLSLFASVLAAYACVRVRYRGAGWVGAATAAFDAGVLLDDDNDRSGALLSRTPSTKSPIMPWAFTHLWYLSKSSVQSQPATPSPRMSTPPGWYCR